MICRRHPVVFPRHFDVIVLRRLSQGIRQHRILGEVPIATPVGESFSNLPVFRQPLAWPVMKGDDRRMSFFHTLLEPPAIIPQVVFLNALIVIAFKYDRNIFPDEIKNLRTPDISVTETQYNIPVYA